MQKKYRLAAVFAYRFEQMETAGKSRITQEWSMQMFGAIYTAGREPSNVNYLSSVAFPLDAFEQSVYCHGVTMT